MHLYHFEKGTPIPIPHVNIPVLNHLRKYVNLII